MVVLGYGFFSPVCGSVMVLVEMTAGRASVAPISEGRKYRWGNWARCRWAVESRIGPNGVSV